MAVLGRLLETLLESLLEGLLERLLELPGGEKFLAGETVGGSWLYQGFRGSAFSQAQRREKKTNLTS